MINSPASIHSAIDEIVRKVTKRPMTPYPERTINQQLLELTEPAPFGLPPAEPVRTVAEQLAELGVDK